MTSLMKLVEDVTSMFINLNDCIACLLLTVILKMDLYRKLMSPLADSSRVYEPLARVRTCSRPVSSLSLFWGPCLPG